MRAEEWERIKIVFEAALSLPEDERLAYVEATCFGEPQLAAIVAGLLSDHAGAGGSKDNGTVTRRHVFAPEQRVASRFRIVGFIGGGGMGEVYEAFDERLRVRVALKTLRTELMSDPQALERFRREILVAREVSHECVCKIFDLVEHSDVADGATVPCLTMQLVEGVSLLTYLQTRRPLATAEALPLIRQIAGAIDALHKHGIIHRDLKPSNIMLTKREGSLHAVVTDFGLAKPSAYLESGLFESQLEFQAGAPYFMAPELLRDGRPSPASDIYSLGMIMDEMVTTTRAFPAESLHSLYYQKLWEAPIAPSARSSQLQPQWDRVILRCLAADAAERYTRAGDAVNELESPGAVAEIQPVSVPAVGSDTSQRMRRHLWPLPPFGTRARIVLAAVALTVAAAVGAVRSLAEPLQTSVVVFPIENLTGKGDLNYLCKGIGAEVMRRLTLIDGVKVIPYYEPRANTNLSQLKGQLSLQGLLQVSGNRARLTAQLTENRGGALMWSQNFERDMQNPLELQSDIAEGSVHALQIHAQFDHTLGVSSAGILPGPLLRLLGFQKVVVPRAATTNPAAFDHYLRGRYLFEERTVPAALDAIRNFEKALQEDPGFALAKAALADTQFVLMDFEYEPLATLVARARGYAEDAVRLNPQLAEGHTALAAVRQAEWDWAGAEESFKTAIRLNPKFARAHRWYAGLLMQFARYDESLAEMGRWGELDPYDYPGQSNMGIFLFYARRSREAAALLEKTLASKDLIIAHLNLGDVYFHLGLETTGAESQDYFARAIQQADLVEAAVRRTMVQSPPISGARSIKYADRMHALYYTVSGRPEAARASLDRLRADTDAGLVSPFSMAMFYAVTGDTEKAMQLLERAADRKDHLLLFLRVSPVFDNLHGNPRFQALLQKMGVG